VKLISPPQAEVISFNKIIDWKDEFLENSVVFLRIEYSIYCCQRQLNNKHEAQPRANEVSGTN